jgi:hypothetical protein
VSWKSDSALAFILSSDGYTNVNLPPCPPLAFVIDRFMDLKKTNGINLSNISGPRSLVIDHTVACCSVLEPVAKFALVMLEGSCDKDM